MQHLIRFASVCTMSALAMACGSSSEDDSQGSEPFATLNLATITATQVYTTTAKPWLNCRVAPGTMQTVVFELTAGSVVDVVSTTTKPANGLIWLEVNPRGDVDHNTCWLAADDRDLKPSDEIDAPLLSLSALVSTQVFKVASNLMCRENPNNSAPVVFDLKPDLILDQVATEFGPAWADQAYWVKVNPRGDIDHNECWVPGLKAALAPVP
ncbi:MAG TPA: hypothetical protein VE954_31655 [Oligoflexus sp.]|uniref:hypothetical protein n=1 Tax=Oligoflexus sp. TaxID=1971216 RepID=UPI002D5EC0D1|nr:hypothetical protein [Oligoflexus sp.]HYX37681.1 hypothetical protein [Oligoflexus sp.]